MPKLVARCITVSLDGFSAAKGQALDAPFGKDGLRLMEWAFATKYFAKMIGQEGGAEGLDNDFLVHAFDNIGATIMGRNMFGPQRGPWPNEDWKGWWGPNPPFHHPVFVLSHHKHSSFEMEGGTSFSFVNDGIESALKQAFAAAKGKDVRIGGGASTVSQYLKAAWWMSCISCRCRCCWAAAKGSLRDWMGSQIATRWPSTSPRRPSLTCASSRRLK